MPVNDPQCLHGDSGGPQERISSTEPQGHSNVSLVSRASGPGDARDVTEQRAAVHPHPRATRPLSPEHQLSGKQV